MTQYTKTDLANRILRDLSVISATEVAQPEDLEFVEDTITSEFALLEADGIRLWNSTDDSIFAPYFTQLARRIALAVAPSYGILSVAEAQNAMEAANDVLRRLSADIKNPESMEVERAARGMANQFARVTFLGN